MVQKCVSVIDAYDYETLLFQMQKLGHFISVNNPCFIDNYILVKGDILSSKLHPLPNIQIFVASH